VLSHDFIMHMTSETGTPQCRAVGDNLGKGAALNAVRSPSC